MTLNSIKSILTASLVCTSEIASSQSVSVSSTVAVIRASLVWLIPPEAKIARSDCRTHETYNFTNKIINCQKMSKKKQCQNLFDPNTSSVQCITLVNEPIQLQFGFIGRRLSLISLFRHTVDSLTTPHHIQYQMFYWIEKSSAANC